MRERALIAEDNDYLRDLLQEALEDAGCWRSGNIEGNYKPAKSCSGYRKFPAGSTPRWRVHFLFDVSPSRLPQALSSSFSQFRVGELKVLRNVFERLLHLHNKPELAIILYE